MPGGRDGVARSVLLLWFGETLVALVEHQRHGPGEGEEIDTLKLISVGSKLSSNEVA